MNVPASLLATLLEQSYRFDLTSEARLQAGLAKALVDLGWHFAREVNIGTGSRIDFLVGDALGVEVKTKGSLAAVTRQLHRYAGSEQVSELLLVTGRVQLARVPPELNGKPVKVAVLFGSLL